MGQKRERVKCDVEVEAVRENERKKGGARAVVVAAAARLGQLGREKGHMIGT